MRFRADIVQCENGRDKVLSVCQAGPDDIEHEVIIQRGPKEYEHLEEYPGPTISCDDVGLDLVSGPDAITFKGDIMTIVLFGNENVEVDISDLSQEDQRDLQEVARELFK